MHNIELILPLNTCYQCAIEIKGSVGRKNKSVESYVNRVFINLFKYLISHLDGFLCFFFHSIFSLRGALLQLPADLWLLLLLRHPQRVARPISGGESQKEGAHRRPTDWSIVSVTKGVYRFADWRFLSNRTWRVPMQQWSMGRLTVCWDWGWALSSTTFFMPSTPGRKHADFHSWWQTIYSHAKSSSDAECQPRSTHSTVAVDSILNMGHAEVHWIGSQCFLSWRWELRVGLVVKWQQNKISKAWLCDSWLIHL